LNLKQPQQTFLVFKKEKLEFQLLYADRNFERVFQKLIDLEQVITTSALNYFNSQALWNKIMVSRPNPNKILDRKPNSNSQTLQKALEYSVTKGGKMINEERTLSLL